MHPSRRKGRSLPSLSVGTVVILRKRCGVWGCSGEQIVESAKVWTCGGGGGGWEGEEEHGTGLGVLGMVVHII